MADIFLFRLMTGEVVVAKTEVKIHVDDRGESVIDEYILESPAGIQMQQDPNAPGGIRVALGDFLPFSEKTDKTITISPFHVLYKHVPSTELFNAYNQLFGSGIIIPGKGGNLPPQPTGGRPGLRLV
jgi:hypothetical protein